MLLRNRFSNVFKASSLRHLSVHNWLRRGGTLRHSGGNSLPPAVIAELGELQTISSSIVLSATPDTVTWRWSLHGNFIVRSAYRFLTFDGVADCSIPHLWRIKIPPNLKVFLWLAARNRLLTADHLARRGWIGPSMCAMCRGASESLEHLLFRCPFAVQVWGWMLQSEELILGTLLSRDGGLACHWVRTRRTLQGQRKSLLDLGFAAICWEIWLERNRRIFTGISSRASHCGVQAKERVLSWMAVRLEGVYTLP